MPSTLALLLWAGFVLFLLRLDRKQAPNLSHALWIPTIWMLCAAGKPFSAWFSSGSVDPEAGSPLDRLFQSGLFCLGLCVLVRRRVDWKGICRDNAWLMLLLGYMLLSILWSEIPFISFRRWVKEMVAVTMALIALTERDPRQAVESLLRRTVYILIPLSLLLIKYFPSLGVSFSRWTGDIMWIGVTLQKNGIGRLCAISALFLVWTLARRWQGTGIAVSRYQTRVEVLLLLLTLWLLKGPSMWAASATGIAALSAGLVAFGALLWLKTHRLDPRPRAWLAIIACIIGLGIVTPLAGGSTVGGLTSALGRNATLTGRTDIWASLLPTVMEQPLLGVGFGGFWTTANIAVIEVNEAHNGYLDVCLGLGALGLLLTVGFLLSFCRRATSALANDYDWASLCICLLLIAVLHNVSESSFDSFNRHLMATVLFLSISVPVARAHSPNCEHNLNEEKEDMSQKATRPSFAEPAPTCNV